MKNIYILLTCLFLTSNVKAQINYISYGDGWRIPLNADISFDIDQDGRTDLYINKKEDELGFSPEFIVGCLASPSDTAYVSFGARKITIFEEGDAINGPDLGFDSFIDDDRGSIWHRNQGFASGWNSNEPQYIGFIILSPENGPIEASSGWMKIMVDEMTEELVIMELAYEEQYNVPISAGATITSTDELTSIESLLIAPIPASDNISISFDNLATQALDIDIYSSTGKKIYDLAKVEDNGRKNIQFDTSALNTGLYYLLFSDGKSIKTKRFTIIR